MLTFFHEVKPRELGVEVTFTAIGKLESIRSRPPQPSVPLSSHLKSPALAAFPARRAMGPGFGHLEGFPAQLVSAYVKDIVLTQLR